MKPDLGSIEAVVRNALQEDAPWGDVTSQVFLSPEINLSGQFVAREAGVLCGEDVFALAMSLTGDVETKFEIHDGASFQAGDVLASVRGTARAVLQAERVALNFVQRLCGIATSTAKYVAETDGTKVRIVDTRKTTPGLRLLERYAVRCGGGHNHRYSLSDAVMLKDNHLAALLGSGHEKFADAVRARAALLPHTTHIEVEVDRLDQIEEALRAGAHTVMLDNFSTSDLRAGVELIAGRALVEASGGITLERIREIAKTGVDLISVGALTQGSRSLDLALDIQV